MNHDSRSHGRPVSHGHFFLIAVSWSKNAFWRRMGFLVAEPRVTTREGNRYTARLEVWYPPRYNTSMGHIDTVVALNDLAAASWFWLLKPR